MSRDTNHTCPTAVCCLGWSWSEGMLPGSPTALQDGVGALGRGLQKTCKYWPFVWLLELEKASAPAQMFPRMACPVGASGPSYSCWTSTCKSFGCMCGALSKLCWMKSKQQTIQWLLFSYHPLVGPIHLPFQFDFP